MSAAYWTRDRIIAALRSSAIGEYGPRSIDWARSAPGHPNQATVRATFGSWNAALEAAGLRLRPARRPSLCARCGGAL